MKSVETRSIEFRLTEDEAKNAICEYIERKLHLEKHGIRIPRQWYEPKKMSTKTRHKQKIEVKEDHEWTKIKHISGVLVIANWMSAISFNPEEEDIEQLDLGDEDDDFDEDEEDWDEDVSDEAFERPYRKKSPK